jgi:inhibitor of cysteine peptidase
MVKKMLEKEVRKKTQAFSLMAIILAASLGALIYYAYVPSASLRTFSSYNELNSFVTKNTPQGYSYYSSFTGPVDLQFSNVLNPQLANAFGVVPPMPTAIPAPAPLAAMPATGFITSAFSGSGPSYSTTNVQVAGVDEADVVKTDGYYIYLLSNSKNAVYILDASPQNSVVLSKISFGNDTSLAGLYLSQNSSRLAVLGSTYTLKTETYSYWTSGSGPQNYTRQYYQPEDTRTFIRVYDISDKIAPVLVRDFSESGSYFNSRMIGEYVYAVISQPVRVINQTVALPTFCAGADASYPPPSSIYYVDREDSSYNYYTFTSVVGLSIFNNAQTAANLTVMMGGASNLYVSTNNIYLTYPGVSTYSVWTGPNEPTTEVQRISISGNNLVFVAKATVPGTVLNQYSMDEYNGSFRIATTSRREGVLQNNIYVLGMNMKQIGKLENLAPGENLHSARFMGDKCYLVTFKKTDPLFVISLSQPNSPQVLGELKIPGYSDYLHPYDETHIIGVGKETEEASYGDFAWYQGLKLSLFDVSNVSAPQQMAKITIGDRGTDSIALSDPKAFLFDRSKSLLVIPVNLAIVNKTLNAPGPSAYGEFVWQGAYVFNVTIEGGFQLKGTITHLETSDSGNTQPWMNTSSWITRALYINNTLYTISGEMVKLNSLDTLQLIAQINLK